jgi:hypothetical protein
MTPDPLDELAEAALAGARFRDDPGAMRARLDELKDEEQAQARAEVEEAIRETPDAFNEALDKRDPAVLAKVNTALGGAR